MARLLDRRKELMKEGIYKAGVALLTQEGCDALTMDRVAEEAGVAKGSLYNYFPNKVELLQFIHDRSVAPMKQRAHEILGSDLLAIDKLRSIILTWFEYVAERRGLFNFLFNDYAVHKFLKIREATGRADAVKDLAIAIQQGVEEGAFRSVDPERAALLLFGGVREVCEQWLATPDSWSLNEMAESVIDVFLNGVGHSAEGPETAGKPTPNK